jgi:hypothetical protein
VLRPLALAAALAAGTSAADEVRLKNGEVFQGVVAIETETQVRIRMADGELRLPKGQVAEVVQAASPYERYLRRRAELEAGALEGGAAASAADWLDLSRQALAQGLRRPAREAAVAAARLDPDTAGLTAVLARFDYVRDGEAGEWIPRSEAMARRGLVSFEGEWIDRAERERRLAGRAEVLAVARRREREAAHERALLRAQAAVTQPAPQVSIVVAPVVAAFPAPWFVLPPSPFPPPVPGEPRRPPPAGRGPVLDLLERQPGSLIPGHLSLDVPRAAPR